jgi:hypothetical protein
MKMSKLEVEPKSKIVSGAKLEVMPKLKIDNGASLKVTPKLETELKPKNDGKGS